MRCEKIYQQFPNADEGVLSRLRASLVNGETLAELATEHQVGEELVLGQGELKSGGRRRKSILSDAFEAIIGALYLDQGFANTKTWLLSVFEKKLDNLSVETADKDPKTKLQEHSLKKFKILPIYKLISNTGPRHKPLFKISVKLKNTKYFTSDGASKKEAEQNAASLCLESIIKG